MKLNKTLSALILLSLLCLSWSNEMQRISDPELDEVKAGIIKASFDMISKVSSSEVSKYSPTKILEMEASTGDDKCYRMLVKAIDDQDGKNIQKLLKFHVCMNTTTENIVQLLDWDILDPTAPFVAVDDQDILKGLKDSVINELSRTSKISFHVRRFITASKTNTPNKSLFFIKSLVEGTDDSIRLYEFWFTSDFKYFASARLPINPQTAVVQEFKPQYNEQSQFNCSSILSYFFCEVTSNCTNNMKATGRCQ